MRTDEEFKSEVYRLGREKIQKDNERRKRIISIMSVGATAACVSLIVWAMSPILVNKNNDAKKETENIKGNLQSEMIEEWHDTENHTYKLLIEDIENDKSAPGETKDTSSKAVLVVQTKSEDKVSTTREIYDKEKLNIFEEFIAKLEKKGVTDNECQTSGGSCVINSTVVYTLFLNDTNGANKKYTLEGNILISSEGKKEYKLNNEQMKEIHKIID